MDWNASQAPGSEEPAGISVTDPQPVQTAWW
jgi:hypothetical protein